MTDSASKSRSKKRADSKEGMEKNLSPRALRATNVYLTRLSPHMNKTIQKPLLKRSRMLYKKGSSLQAYDDEVNERIYDHQRTLESLGPKLHKSDSNSAEKQKQDNQYSLTFGFSHGAGGRGAGVNNIQKLLKSKGIKKDAE